MTLKKALQAVADAGASLYLKSGAVKILTNSESRPIPDEALSYLRQHRNKVIKHLEQTTVIKFRGGLIPIKTWSGETLGPEIAIDTETCLIDKDKIDHPPALVLSTAYDGENAVFIGPEKVEAFIEHHQGHRLVFHNSRFDVRVLEKVFSRGGHILAAIDQDLVWDTLLLEALINLAKFGDPFFQSVGLDACSERYLGIGVPKDLTDDDGDLVRISYSKHVGKEPGDLPAVYREYAGLDPIATWHVLQEQRKVLAKIKKRCRKAYGFISDDHLDSAWSTYGPLSLFIQVKASVVFGYMTELGFGRDLERVEALKSVLINRKVESEGIMEEAGIGPGKGSADRREKYLSKIEKTLLESEEITKPLPRTTKTGRIATSKTTRDLILGLIDDKAISAWGDHDRAVKWVSTYLKSLADPDKPTVQINWQTMARSGRTRTGKGSALPAQCLPKDRLAEDGDLTVRQCLKAALKDHVVIGADYNMLEIVTMAAAVEQLGFGSDLADVVRSGRDVHKALAAVIHGIEESEVTKDQRALAKICNFGFPGGFQGKSFQAEARKAGLDLSLEDVSRVSDAYKAFNPAFEQHMAQHKLGYLAAKMINARFDTTGWQFLGLMAGKKWSGHKIKDEDLHKFWGAADEILRKVPISDGQRSYLRSLVRKRKSHPDLWEFFREECQITSQLSGTGRLRGRASFRGSRNGLFQAPASDGGLLACWNLFRAGYKVCGFIHDEILAIVPANGHQWDHADRLGEIMVETMTDLIGIKVGVETFVRSSLSPKDDLPRPVVVPDPDLPPVDAFFTDPNEIRIEWADETDPDEIKIEFQPRKKRQRADQVSTGGRKTWSQQVKSGRFEDGSLPF